jgi:hypothetical protein
MEGVNLNMGTWDSSSPPRVFDEVIRPRGLSDEHNMIGLCNVLCHPHPEGKAAWETVKILFSTIWYPLISTINASFIVFLCSPFFHKSRDEISTRGGL